MEHFVCVASMLNPKVWGSWHPFWSIQYWPLPEMLIRMVQYHACGSGNAATRWSCARCGFLQENAWRCYQPPIAVLAVVNPHAVEWPNSKAVLPFRTGYKLGKKRIALPYLFILWYARWSLLQMLWFSSMLPRSERKGKTTSARKVQLGACTLRAESKSNQPRPWTSTVLDNWIVILALVKAETLDWHLPAWVWRIWNKFSFLYRTSHQERCGTREMSPKGYSPWWPEKILTCKLGEILLVPLQLQLVDDELLLLQMEVIPCHLLWERLRASCL